MPRHALLTLCLLPLFGCTHPVESPGHRGSTVPRHIKPPSYEKRDVPRHPMSTFHVLETKDTCGNRCEFLHNGQSTVTLHLTDDGVAAAEDSGELVERLTSAAEKSSTLTEWTRTWTGSWSEGENSLEVVLKPEQVECKRTRDDGAIDQSCAKRRSLRLRCRLASLDLVRPRERAARAWACRARGREPTSLTPLPWVFGIKEAIIVLDGGTTHEPTRRYALEKGAAEPAPESVP